MAEVKEHSDFESQPALSFLANTCLDKSYPPNSFFYLFEVERMSFNITGTIHGKDHERCIFLIGNFMFYKILIKLIFFNIDENFRVDDSIDKGHKCGENTKKLLKQIGCYLYSFYLIDIVEDLEKITGTESYQNLLQSEFTFDILEEENLEFRSDVQNNFKDSSYILINGMYSNEEINEFLDSDEIKKFQFKIDMFLEEVFAQIMFVKSAENWVAKEKKYNDREIIGKKMLGGPWNDYAEKLLEDVKIKRKEHEIQETKMTEPAKEIV